MLEVLLGILYENLIPQILSIFPIYTIEFFLIISKPIICRVSD